MRESQNRVPNRSWRSVFLWPAIVEQRQQPADIPAAHRFKSVRADLGGRCLYNPAPMKLRLARWLLMLSGYLPLPLLHACGWLVGRVLWWIPNKLRAITLQHLRLCLPELDDAQRRRIARQSLGHMAMAVLEAPAIWFGPQGRLRTWLKDPAAEAALRGACADGGTIVLCPHLGAWELAGMFCAAQGQITSLYKPQKGVFDQLILEGRQRLGARLVPTIGSGVKALLEALLQGEMIGVLPDHDPPPGAGVFAPLFGIQAHTTELVSKLAARTGAPVWFCYAERLAFGRGFRLHVMPAPDGVADKTQGVTAMNHGVEQCLRHLPQQYWWSYKRYRRRPPGQPDFYDEG